MPNSSCSCDVAAKPRLLIAARGIDKEGEFWMSRQLVGFPLEVGVKMIVGD